MLKDLKDSKKLKILVLATTPPPFHGQGIMTEKFLQASYTSIHLYHVRMSFSQSISSLGKIDFQKFLHMFNIIFKALWAKNNNKIKVLYYVPGGSTKVPIIRDIIILSALRVAFRQIVFHFHSAGISEIIEDLPGVLKLMANRVYRNADLSIYLSERNPDNKYFTSKTTLIVPNGLEDYFVNRQLMNESKTDAINILFVGIVGETKGVSVLVKAMHILIAMGFKVVCNIVGDFSDADYGEKIKGQVKQLNLTNHVFFRGVQMGDEKWNYFLKSDIFCYPSFYAAESFGNVLVEAMMFQLPVIATRWRGIPDIVEDNETGFLIAIDDEEALSLKIQTLINDPALRKRFGNNGREKFLEKYHLDVFLRNMEVGLTNNLK